MSRNEHFEDGANQGAVGASTTIRVHAGDGKHVALTGKILDESDTHLTIHSKRPVNGSNVVRVHKDRIKNREDVARRQRSTRTPEDRDSARRDLLSQVGEDWQRTPEGASRSDVSHLIKSGHLESEVREEFDPQGGKYASSKFGGAGVVKRRRQYVRKSKP